MSAVHSTTAARIMHGASTAHHMVCIPASSYIPQSYGVPHQVPQRPMVRHKQDIQRPFAAGRQFEFPGFGQFPGFPGQGNEKGDGEGVFSLALAHSQNLGNTWFPFQVCDRKAQVVRHKLSIPCSLSALTARCNFGLPNKVSCACIHTANNTQNPLCHAHVLSSPGRALSSEGR
jgi:hypothetical protein